jgi:ubiquinone/menaquinone biosynthesis C-methylase UbiE
MRRDGASGHSRPPVIPRRHQVPQQAFDLVVSIFGAMFAPKPFEVAKEMVRVTRPGGRIIMGNWIPNDPTLVAQS